MIRIDIPGRSPLLLENLLVDINGTLSFDGKLSPKTIEKIRFLSRKLRVCLISADSRNNASRIAEGLGIELFKITGDERSAKAGILRTIGPEKSAVLGNGYNDSVIIKEAALGICVLGREGASPHTLMASHIVVCSPEDGLDLLLRPKRLIASLRG